MNKNINWKFLIKCIDLIIIVLVISFLIYDLMAILTSMIENLFKLLSNSEFVVYMAESSNNSTNHTTNVQITHNDGSWSNGIRSLFIYGAGALRISMLKNGGTPT